MTTDPRNVKQSRASQTARSAVESRVRASTRVGYTARERITWLLDFIQRDISRASDGDLLNLNEEVQAYGSPVTTGFYILDTAPFRLSRTEISELQAQVRDYLSGAMKGGTLTSDDITIQVAGAKNPKTGKFEIARCGKTNHLLKFQVIEDLRDIELQRIRKCERGATQSQHKLKIKNCGKLFFAKDLRQHFCSPECAQDVRWTKYWKKHGENINQKRRKTDRRRKSPKAK